MGYVKTYRNSKNIMNPAEVDIYANTSLLGTGEELLWSWSSTSSGRTIRIPCQGNTKYVLKPYDNAFSSTFWRVATTSSTDYPSSTLLRVDVNTIASSATVPTNGTYFITGNDIKYIVFQLLGSVYTDINDLKTIIGLYEVSNEAEPTPATCEPYNTVSWYDWIKKKTADGWTDGTAQKAPF